MNGVTMNGASGSESDQDSDSDEFGQEPLPEGADGAQGGLPSMEHRRKQASGAPEPLEPELVTLSLLPRSQWQSLVHLDAIKVGGVASSGLSCCVLSGVGCCGGWQDRVAMLQWVSGGYWHRQIASSGCHQWELLIAVWSQLLCDLGRTGRQ